MIYVYVYVQGNNNIRVQIMDISQSFHKKLLFSIVFITTFGFGTIINVPGDYSETVFLWINS